MSWRIEDHPEGGMLIRHLARPRFTARWTTGEFPLEVVREGAFFWSDEGSGEEDAIHLFSFEWNDTTLHGNALEELMFEAVAGIEKAIMRRA